MIKISGQLNKQKAEAIQTLQRLKPILNGDDTQTRILFVTTLYTWDLYHDLITHNLNYHGLASTDIDHCFSRSDKRLVVHGIMSKALKNKALKRSIQKRGKLLWNCWFDIYIQI